MRSAQRAFRVAAFRAPGTGLVVGEELEVGGMREFGSAAEAPELRIEDRFQFVYGRVQGSSVRPVGGGGPFETAQGLHQRLVLTVDRRALAAVIIRDAGEQIAEARHAVARLRRKVRAAEKRDLVLRRKEHGERPAAGAAREQLLRRLVDLVDVRAFLAIHLDVHEVRVHQRRRRLVLEGLVRHDVAPVAGRVADGQQDRLVLAPRAIQRLRSPRMPLHGVVRVLEQVWTGFVDERVDVLRVLHAGVKPA
jgi:hypothetical protein